VVKLRADLALRFDTVGPMDDRSVARAAEVGSHLLGPLVGRAHRMRPTEGVVAERIRPAELVEVQLQEFRRLNAQYVVED
jgi:hypothetical protein